LTNPTSNYGFVLPTATDLVTDLPADFEVALQGVDTRLKALQPGTTLGDIAYSSATANTNTRLGIGTAGQVLAVSGGGVPAWTTTADVTPLTTKGDLFTFDTADARLAVGNNGETLVADSAATTGLRYQSAYNGNAMINGGMDIWQRGTSFTSVAATYTADRWFGARPGNAVGLNISRQVTGDTTNLPTIQYCLRAQRASANANTDSYYIGYNLETTDSIRFAGQTVVLSFYARAGANYSPTSSGFIANIYTGTGTDQNVNNGFTGSANPSSVTHTLTTTWQRFQQTVTLSASATQVGFLFIAVPTGTASTNDYFEITGVQFELGARSTTFKRSNGAGGSIQGELAACQRYYFRIQDGNNGAYGGGIAQSTTQFNAAITTPVTMRVIPTVLDYSALRGVLYGVAGYSISSASISSADSSKNVVIVTCNATGLTQKQFYPLTGDGSGTYIGLGAEL
jgi:hypothetical protein